MFGSPITSRFVKLTKHGTTGEPRIPKNGIVLSSAGRRAGTGYAFFRRANPAQLRRSLAHREEVGLRPFEPSEFMQLAEF